MIELEWKEFHEHLFILDTGSVRASCCYNTPYFWGRRWWCAYVRILDREVNIGPKRLSLAKAKEDAARMIEEKLLDLSVGVKQELKNYGIEP